MSLPNDTVDATKSDVEANPSHVRDQPTAAMTPDNTVPGSSDSNSNEIETKDLEGISEIIKPQGSEDEAVAGNAGGKPKRQKKLAVLTSGGDSAGMNAAGEFDKGTCGCDSGVVCGSGRLKSRSGYSLFTRPRGCLRNHALITSRARGPRGQNSLPSLQLEFPHSEANDQSEPLSDKVSPVDVKPTSFEKDGRVSSVATPQSQHPPLHPFHLNHPLSPLPNPFHSRLFHRVNSSS